jgi:hypothetical protein
LMRAARDRVIRTRVAVPGFERPTIIRGKDIKRIVLGTDDDGLIIRLPYNRGIVPSDAYPSEVTVRGDDALRVAGSVLPAVNAKGGKREEIDTAVKFLEQTPDARTLFANGAGFGRVASRALTRRRRSRRPSIDASEVFLDRIPAPMLLAMEMAAHEDVERRAMEGELAILEAAWRQAEEIASIADNLFVPKAVDDELKRLSANEPLARGSGD